MFITSLSYSPSPNYRMICKYHFGITKVRLFVCWIGTHAEYDELCDQGEQYIVFEY